MSLASENSLIAGDVPPLWIHGIVALLPIVLHAALTCIHSPRVEWTDVVAWMANLLDEVITKRCFPAADSGVVRLRGYAVTEAPAEDWNRR